MNNRIIKFRAWNKLTKTMLPPSELSMMPRDTSRGSKDETVGTIYLQWTGLKDKNGVLIYEGDIVKYEVVDNPDKVVKIVWNNDMASYGLEPLDDEPVYFGLYNNSGEVIGNAYENPELLTQSK